MRHEQLVNMAWIAARTERIRLVTAVLVVPHRPAVLTAKMLATIDVLSGGRLVVGVGAGWLKAEFYALGTPPFEERGAAVTDEYLAAFRALWTEERPHFEGTYTRFANVLLEPKPVQTPHPPIWVGGESPPALRRAARLGDAWYPIGTNRQKVVYRVKRIGTELPARASDGERKLFSGGDVEIVADLKAMQEIGVTGVDFDIERPEPEAALREMSRLRRELVERL